MARLERIKGIIPKSPTPGYELGIRLLQELALIDQFKDRGDTLSADAEELYHLLLPLAHRWEITAKQKFQISANSSLAAAENRFVDRADIWLNIKFPEEYKEKPREPVQQGAPVHQEIGRAHV